MTIEQSPAQEMAEACRLKADVWRRMAEEYRERGVATGNECEARRLLSCANAWRTAAYELGLLASAQTPGETP